MTTSTELIVLHTTKFGENSIVVHTLSRDYGRRSFLVRGAGKKVMSLLLPLNILEAEITESTKSTLYTARNLTSRHPLLGIRNNIYKNTMTMFLSEVIYRTIKEGAQEHDLFEWCRGQILLLSAMESDFSNFHIRFLLELSVALGFSPETSDLMPFVEENYTTVSEFMTSSFAESMLIPLSGPVRNKICEDVLRYIEYHSESTLTINSLKVLRELFV
jgi:DNA repair protein RecO (recombination protein O)